mgnify:CR=1 FL=1
MPFALRATGMSSLDVLKNGRNPVIRYRAQQTFKGKESQRFFVEDWNRFLGFVSAGVRVDHLQRKRIRFRKRGASLHRHDVLRVFVRLPLPVLDF